MAESAQSITYSELLDEVAAFLGYREGRSAAEIAEVDRYVQSGVRQFYFPPSVEGIDIGDGWAFMHPTATIITVDGEGTSDLPDDLGRVLGDFFYGDTLHRSSIPVMSEARILSLLQSSTDEGFPAFAAIRYKTQGAGEGQRLEAAWWPIPDAAYTLSYRYEAYSGKLSAENPYHLGGMMYSELVLESCLAIAEQRANDERGMHTDNFYRLLAAGIAKNRSQGARHFGPMAAPREPVSVTRHPVGSSYPITYKGETW